MSAIWIIQYEIHGLDAMYIIKHIVEPNVLLALKQAQVLLFSAIDFLVQRDSNMATYFKCLNLASTKFSEN